MKTYVINAIVALLLIIGVGTFTPRPQQSDVQNQNQDLSGLSERDINSVSVITKALRVNGGTISGTVNASSTLVTVQPFAKKDFVGYATISYTPNAGSTSLYLPATSTLRDWLPGSGDRTSFTVFNATTTSGITLGLVTGTGTLVTTASSTLAGTASTSATNGMRVDVLRKANTDLLFMVTPFK